MKPSIRINTNIKAEANALANYLHMNNKSSTKTLICVDKRDLTEQIALTLADMGFSEHDRDSISVMSMRIVKDIERMANNRKGK